LYLSTLLVATIVSITLTPIYINPRTEVLEDFFSATPVDVAVSDEIVCDIQAAYKPSPPTKKTVPAMGFLA